MDKTCADYLAAAKAALGNPLMSDRELGKHLGGFAQQTVWKAKAGNMSDPLALAVAGVLPDVDAGEVLWVARMERENDPLVKSALQAYVGKVMAVMPSKAGARSAFGGVVAAVAISAAAPSPSQAQTITAPAANAQSLCIMSTVRRRAAANESRYKVAA